MSSRRQIERPAAAELEQMGHGASAGESKRERQSRESILQMTETIARLEDDIKAKTATIEYLRQENSDLRGRLVKKEAQLQRTAESLNRANEQRARQMQIVADDSEAGTETGLCGMQ
ncbi:hypothetical protein JOL62DRAFT_560597 [Phyllosticta paracitricarpa]|uniref:Uncharacterized protein n=2 Tax=Phyllosticta TaxID=121621 RepID=A0ABR1L9D9_9PEZI